MSKNFSLCKKERIKRRSDINSLFDNGVCVEYLSGIYFYVRFKRNSFYYSRFFVGIKRGNYSAVERNRLKRIVRELYRTNKSFIPQGFDYFILIKGSPNTAFNNYEKDFVNLFRRVNK